jgi:hypothetical protein
MDMDFVDFKEHVVALGENYAKGLLDHLKKC